MKWEDAPPLREYNSVQKKIWRGSLHTHIPSKRREMYFNGLKFKNTFSKQTVPPNIKVANSLVISHFNYCGVVYAPCLNSPIKKDANGTKHTLSK